MLHHNKSFWSLHHTLTAGSVTCLCAPAALGLTPSQAKTVAACCSFYRLTNDLIPGRRGILDIYLVLLFGIVNSEFNDTFFQCQKKRTSSFIDKQGDRVDWTQCASLLRGSLQQKAWHNLGQREWWWWKDCLLKPFNATNCNLGRLFF